MFISRLFIGSGKKNRQNELREKKRTAFTNKRPAVNGWKTVPMKERHSVNFQSIYVFLLSVEASWRFNESALRANR